MASGLQAVANKAPGNPVKATSQSVVVIERIQNIAGQAESLLAAAARIQMKLFGPEPSGLPDENAKTPPPSGFFGAAHGNLDVLEAIVNEAVGILHRIEDRVEF